MAVTKEKEVETEVEESAVEAEAEAEATEGAEVETEAEPEAEATEEADVVDEDEGDEDDGDLRLKGKSAKKEKVSLRDRPWGRYARRSVMPVLLVLSLSLSAFLGWRQWEQHEINEAGQQARQAAIAYADVLTSIDSNNLDKNFRDVLDGATGEFKDQYTQSSVQLRQLLVDNKATAHGTVVDSAIMSASTDRVEVLLFIDQTVTNTKMPDPRIDRSRIKMTMEKVDGRWRAAKVQLL